MVHDNKGNIANSLLSRLLSQSETPLEESLRAVSSSVEAKEQQIQESLFTAISQKDANAIAKALKQGANPNICNKDGCAPLFLAIESGTGTGARLLIKAKADINFRGNKKDYARQDQTAFHRAIELSHTAMADLLFTAGADINLPALGKNGNSPLSSAILKNDPQLTQTLIAMNAKIFDTKLGRRSPIFLATLHAKLPILEIIIKSTSNIDFTTLKGETPLMAAIDAGRKNTAEFLLKHGANPNAIDNNGKTILQRAIGSIIARPNIDLLLKYKADPDLTDFSKPSYEPPLITCLKAKQPIIFKKLLEAGADPNLPNSKNQTALEIAAYLSTNSIEKLQNKANKNITSTITEDLKNYRKIILQLRLYGARCNSSYIQRLGDRFTNFLPSRQKLTKKHQKREDISRRIPKIANPIFKT